MTKDGENRVVDSWTLLFDYMVDEDKPKESAEKFIKCMKTRFFNPNKEENFPPEVQERFFQMLEGPEYNNIRKELNLLIPIQISNESGDELFISGGSEDLSDT